MMENQSEQVLHGLNERNKDIKRNFYDFRNIYKFDDFCCVSDHNSYYNQKSLNNSNVNPNQILVSFKKNISTYLIIKKHYESKSNKYLNLISKLKYFKEKRGKFLANFLNNESIVDNGEIKIEQSFQNQDLEKSQIQFLDIQSYNSLKKRDEKKIINLEFIIDSDGIQKKLKKSLDINKLESKFLKKYEFFLNNPDNSNEIIIEKLSQNFEKLLKKIKFLPFLIKLPKGLKASNQEFNDFYFYDEINSDILELKSITTNESNKNFTEEQKENFKEQTENIVIEQILNLDNNNGEQLENLIELDSQEKIDNDENKNKNKNKKEEILLDSIHVMKKTKNIQEKNNSENNNDKNHVNSSRIYNDKKDKKIENENDSSSLPKVELVKNNDEYLSEELKKKNDYHERKKSEILIKNENLDSKKENQFFGFDSEKLLIKKIQETEDLGEEEEKKFPSVFKSKKSNMELIEKLLNSKDIFSEDLSELKCNNFVYPEIPNDQMFADNTEKEIFQKIFFWLYEVELQIVKDKKDIQEYEGDYQAKFLNFLKNETIEDIKHPDSLSAFESDEEDDEETSNYSEN